MDVNILHILPQYPSQIHVQWNLKDPDPLRTAGIQFEVLRSGSPRGPWESRKTNISGVYYTDLFKDGPNDETEENLLALNREVWYTVRAHLADGEVLESAPVDNYGTLPTEFDHVDGVGLVASRDQSMADPQTIFSPQAGVSRRLQLIQRSIQRKAIIAIQFFSGVTVAILKRKHFGTRCTQCFDQAVKMVTLSNCKICYGTGWEGGYFEPILSYARIKESQPDIQSESSSKTIIVQSQVELLDFPRLEKEDIIVEVDNNKRWIVHSMGVRVLRRQRITQHATCRELERSASEYKVPVNRKTLTETTYAP